MYRLITEDGGVVSRGTEEALRRVALAMIAAGHSGILTIQRERETTRIYAECL